MAEIQQFEKIVLGAYTYVPSDEADLPKLRRMATAKRRFGGAPVKMYKPASNGWFGVPRYLTKLVGVTEVDKRSPGRETGIKMDISYRMGQSEVMETFEKRLHSGITGFLLKAPPGFGKTLVLIKMMEIVGLTALVVVPRSNLVEQWVSEICRHTNLSRSKVGVVSGTDKRPVWIGKQVVVGLVHTLALDRMGSSFKKYFGLTVFDEVDRSVPPETFSTVVAMFPSKYRIGATATMKRSDGLDKVFRAHIGETLIEAQKGDTMKAKVLVLQFTGSSGYLHMASKKLRRRGMLISKVSKNPGRNMILAKYIHLIAKTDRRVLILSDRKEQLGILMGMMEKQYGYSKKQMGMYIHGRTQAELDHIASASKLIWGTYGMIAVGTDIPDLAGLVMATPQSNATQLKGRIERFFHGKMEPVLVDVIDTHYTDALDWGYRRLKAYRREGLKVRRVVV